MSSMMAPSLLAMLAAEGGPLAIDLVALARGPSGTGGTERRAGAVTVIPVQGALMARGYRGYGASIPGMTDLRASIDAAARNPDIGAIVLDMDTPGGTVTGTAETAASVRAAAAVKPVVAVANGLAASAGYWIAAGATEIVMAPNAEVGSIGVVMPHQSMARMYDRMGIDTTLISTAPYKAEGSPYAPLTEEARAALTARAQTAHDAFVADVATGRRTTPAAVEETFGRGRMVGVADAIRSGMADRTATLDAVVAGLLQGDTPRPRRRRTAAAFAFAFG
jgi:signal peptide peptidase SppA